MLTTGRSLTVSLVVFTAGTSTSMPDSITWAVSIKMISSTSSTSTNGVTLISDSAAPPRRPPRPRPPLSLVEKATGHSSPLLLKVALGHIQELDGEVVHARADFLEHVTEVVVENSRRNSRAQADRGREQRVGDARPHRTQRSAARLAQLVEGA